MNRKVFQRVSIEMARTDISVSSLSVIPQLFDELPFLYFVQTYVKRKFFFDLVSTMSTSGSPLLGFA